MGHSINKENVPIYEGHSISNRNLLIYVGWLECSPMVLNASLLNTQHYKVQIKGKVEQSRERSSALPYTLVEKLSKKGAFGSPSTMVTNFTLFTNT